MIIKEKYNPQTPIKTLETILSLPSLTGSTKKQVQEELRKVQSGLKGEKEAAYYIDYHYGDNKNWVIIHDLRLKHKKRVAQIDHLMINRCLDFYVLETKHFSQGLQITEQGEFLVKYGQQKIAIPSPIEQNRRHIILLKQVLKDSQILPKRLGAALQPRLKSYVLVSSHSRMVRPATMAFDTQEVIKADTLFSRLDAELEQESTISILGSLTKLVAVETLHEIGYKLAERHQPHELDYYARFGINREMVVPNDKQHTIGTEKSGKGQGKKSKYYCFKCQKSISQKAALFCFDDKARFGGRAYCFSCQKQFKRP